MTAIHMREWEAEEFGRIAEFRRNNNFVEILGRPRAISQFNIPYITYVNGYQKPEGAPAVIIKDGFVACIEETIKIFQVHLKLEKPVIVWRDFPEASSERYEPQTINDPFEVYKIRFRAHFMTREELKNFL